MTMSASQKALGAPVFFAFLPLTTKTQCPSDGAINITAAGGTTPYQYEWYLEGELVSNEEDLYFVPAGNYTLILTDAGGCSRTWTDLIISRIASDQAFSENEPVAYPGKLIKYIKVFPNPSTEEVNLELELKGEAEIEITLLNQLGELLQVVPKIYSDQQQFQFYLGDNADGIYHLKVIVDDMIYVKKILILH